MRNLLDSPSCCKETYKVWPETKKLIFSKLTKIQLKGHVKNQPLGYIGTFLFWRRILFLSLSFDLIHKAWLWFTFGSLSKNKTLLPLKIFFFPDWTSVLKAALREFQRGASSQGDERLHSLKYRSSSVFVFRNLSSYPETILYLRKHLVLRTALGPLRRSLKCTYSDSWGERRRKISQTKAYCFLSHWLECCICQSKVLGAVWMHPYLGLWCHLKIIECHCATRN